MTGAASPPQLGEPALVVELGEVLRAAGLTGEGVRETLGATGSVVSRTVDVPVHMRRLREAGPIGTLVQLLVLDSPASADDARAAFAPLSLERVEALGVLSRDGDEVAPLVRIVPHDELLIASDRRLGGDGQGESDHVAGVHEPSLTLSKLTVRRPVERALDVGAGSGIQAILAAPHSEHVVATDINERALAFAAFNALLNGRDNIAVRAGSFFEPAEGERFGLITCNPPYVISPDTAFVFRDGGMEGDAVSRLVVEAAPDYLEEGGFASMLVSWVAPAGDDLAAPLREWVDGRGCDAWLLYYGTDDPLSHASKWLRDDFGADPRAFDTAIGRWLEYLQRLGIGGVSHGAVVMRLRSGRHWVRTDKLSAERLQPASDHILRVFEANDFLAGLGEPHDLLAERLVLADAALLEQRVVLREREWTVDEVGLSIGDGLGFRAGLDQPTARMIASLDGKRTLGDVADELARLEGSSRAAVEESAVAIASEMLGAGFLVRA